MSFSVRSSRASRAAVARRCSLASMSFDQSLAGKENNPALQR